MGPRSSAKRFGPTPAISSVGLGVTAAPAFTSELVATLARLVEVAAAEDHLGSEAAHRCDFHRVRALGRADRGRDAEQARRVGDGLPVVSRRRGEDAVLPLLGRELRDEVDAAPDLEGADRLVVLVLDEHRRPDQVVERGVPVERRRAQVRCDPPACVEHVGEGRRLPLRHLASVSPPR
jgi:hypothetical protein